jgi:hypothetical protein
MGQAVIPQDKRIAVGWREWVALPELGISAIKAKVDTGARTSALHTFELQAYREKGRDMVRFNIHPLQRHTEKVIVCRAPVIDRRWVSDSGGHRELRYIIMTPLHLGPHVWPIEITLTARDPMRFRMLLGRTAMADRVQVIPDASYLAGKLHPTRH